MVDGSFDLGKALAFLFVAVLIASPLFFILVGVSFFEFISVVFVIWFVSGVFTKDLYRVFCSVIGYKRLDGKYGGSGKWEFSSISGHFFILIFGIFSAKMFSFSLFDFCGVYYV